MRARVASVGVYGDFTVTVGVARELVAQDERCPKKTVLSRREE